MYVECYYRDAHMSRKYKNENVNTVYTRESDKLEQVEFTVVSRIEAIASVTFV